MLGSNQRFDVRGGFINDTDEEKIPDTVRASDAVMCSTYNMDKLTHKARSEVLNAESIEAWTRQGLQSTQSGMKRKEGD